MNEQIVSHSIHGAKYGFAKADLYHYIAELLGNIIMLIAACCMIEFHQTEKHH